MVSSLNIQNLEAISDGLLFNEGCADLNACNYDENAECDDGLCEYIEEIDLGEGFQVGHSYFCPDGNGPYNNSWYEKKIKYKVEPLLKEYWFDNPGRVQSLLEDL